MVDLFYYSVMYDMDFKSWLLFIAIGFLLLVIMKNVFNKDL
jgi:hypothetical protein